MTSPAKPWELPGPKTNKNLGNSQSNGANQMSDSVNGVKPNKTINNANSTMSAPAVASSTNAVQDNIANSAYGVYDAGGNRSIGEFGHSGYGGIGYGAAGYGSNGYGGAGYMNSGFGSSGYGYGGGNYGHNGMLRNIGPYNPHQAVHQGNMGWLVSFNQMVYSIGQITEILGMNAEALNFCFGNFVQLIERMTAVTQNMVRLLAPRQPFPPGHPRYGEPAPNKNEEDRRLRRIRIVRFFISLLVAYGFIKGVKRFYKAFIARQSRIAIGRGHEAGLEMTYRN